MFVLFKVYFLLNISHNFKLFFLTFSLSLSRFSLEKFSILFYFILPFVWLNFYIIVLQVVYNCTRKVLYIISCIGCQNYSNKGEWLQSKARTKDIFIKVLERKNFFFNNWAAKENTSSGFIMEIRSKDEQKITIVFYEKTYVVNIHIQLS